MTLGQHQRVQREGGASHEFLVQQALLKYVSASGVGVVAPVLRDPLPLTEGKSDWAIFMAQSSSLLLN